MSVLGILRWGEPGVVDTRVNHWLRSAPWVHITSAQLPRYKKIQSKLHNSRIGEVYKVPGSESYSRVCVGCGRRPSNAINARIATQSREAQAFGRGWKKGEEVGRCRSLKPLPTNWRPRPSCLQGMQHPKPACHTLQHATRTSSDSMRLHLYFCFHFTDRNGAGDC
jgi:hypothetical protein